MSGFDADLLVVGLGPAGASAAAAAAAAGARVIALDARRAPGWPVQCAEFVPAALLQELPWLDEVSVQPIARMRSFVGGAAPEITPHFPGLMIDRAAFDRRLAEAAVDAGARLLTRKRVVAILPAEAGIVTADGAIYRARAIIGADGPRSLVGAATGRINRALVETRQLSIPLRQRHDATDIFLSAEYPGGYGWLFPKGGMANLGLGLAAGARGRLKPLLSALHARLAAEGMVERAALGLTGGAIPVGGRLPAVAFAGAVPLILAGDAAGLANPVTGAGIASAVQSGRLAGAAAAAWLAGDAAALDDLAEETAALFDASLTRAVQRRAALAATPHPGPAALRQGWIAFPAYWSEIVPPFPAQEVA
jgi:geranylgeranyl reductase family protein